MKIETLTTGLYFTNSYVISNDKKECIIVDPGLSYKNAAEYIKKNIKDTKIILDSIIGRVYNNRPSQTSLKLNSLESEELYKIINKSNNINGAYEIILMNEDKYKVFNEIYHLNE